MTFVVIAKQIKIMLPIIEKMEGIYLIKLYKAKGYFYYHGDKPIQEVMKSVVREVTEKLGALYMINIFEIYNEVTDIAPHIEKSQKNNYAYYHEAKKELTDQEVAEFKKKMGFE